MEATAAVSTYHKFFFFDFFGTNRVNVVRACSSYYQSIVLAIKKKNQTWLLIGKMHRGKKALLLCSGGGDGDGGSESNLSRRSV